MNAKAIADWLCQRVTGAGARGLVVGLSGGIDSAVVVPLCQMATPGQVVGVIMPCHSDPRDEADARLVAEHFGLAVLRIDLGPAYDQFVKAARAVLNELPSDMMPPRYRKQNPADSPILYLSLTSKTLPLSQVNEFAETFMAQRISTVAGVSQVDVFGQQKYAVRIQLDPNALAVRGIGIDEVAAAVAAGNVNLPNGVLWGPDKAYTLEASGQLENAAAFRPLIVAWRNGAPVRLQDLGKVEDDVQDNRVAAWYNGVRSVVLAIRRQPGTNTVQVADAVVV